MALTDNIVKGEGFEKLQKAYVNIGLDVLTYLPVIHELLDSLECVFQVFDKIEPNLFITEDQKALKDVPVEISCVMEACARYENTLPFLVYLACMLPGLVEYQKQLVD